MAQTTVWKMRAVGANENLARNCLGERFYPIAAHTPRQTEYLKNPARPIHLHNKIDRLGSIMPLYRIKNWTPSSSRASMRRPII